MKAQHRPAPHVMITAGSWRLLPVGNFCSVARPSQGSSLVEVLLALTMGTLLLGAITSTFINQRKTYAIRAQVVQMQENARAGLDFMTRDIMMTGYDPTEAIAAGVVVANATTFQGTMDLNGNGNTDDANENVTYLLTDVDGDGDQDLARQTDGETQLVAANVINLSFLYTLDDNTTVPTPANLSRIRVVHITLTARTAERDQHYTVSNGYRRQTLTTRVQLRNRAL
jgi:Tfp pilus assembly protein PilW